MEYEYGIALGTATGKVHIQYLADEIKESTLPNAPIYITTIEEIDLLRISFNPALTTEEKEVLDAVVTAHSADPLDIYKTLVGNAIGFFTELMIQYAAENITQGITYYGKTKEVADYLQEVMRYGQSGSLYEVVHSIEDLINTGVPSGLSPFVTAARLNQMKDEVNSYLGV